MAAADAPAPVVAPRARTVVRFEGSDFAVALPALAEGIAEAAAQAATAELADTAAVWRAIDALGELTAVEVEVLAELACLDGADTPARRSWRRRLLLACAALAKVDSALHRPILMHLRWVRAGAPEDGPSRKRPPLTPLRRDDAPASR